MNKRLTKKFIGDYGFICNKCKEVFVDGTKHKNKEDLCDQCRIIDLKTKLAEKDQEIEILKGQLEYEKKWLGYFKQSNMQLIKTIKEQPKQIVETIKEKFIFLSDNKKLPTLYIGEMCDVLDTILKEYSNEQNND